MFVSVTKVWWLISAISYVVLFLLCRYFVLAPFNRDKWTKRQKKWLKSATIIKELLVTDLFFHFFLLFFYSSFEVLVMKYMVIYKIKRLTRAFSTVVLFSLQFQAILVMILISYVPDYSIIVIMKMLWQNVQKLVTNAVSIYSITFSYRALVLRCFQLKIIPFTLHLYSIIYLN